MKQHHGNPGDPVEAVALGSFFAQARAAVHRLQRFGTLAHQVFSPHRMCLVSIATIPRVRGVHCNTSVIADEARGYGSNCACQVWAPTWPEGEDPAARPMRGLLV